MAQEFLGPLTGRVLENLRGAAAFDDHAVFGEIDNVADLFGEAHLVGDQHAGHALFGKLANHCQHLADGFRIKSRGHFIEQNQFRTHRQRPGNRHTLLLTAGQLSRIGVGLVLHSHFGQ
ncbi:hypothetical protein D3C84_940550 [compost metagenome]